MVQRHVPLPFRGIGVAGPMPFVADVTENVFVFEVLQNLLGGGGVETEGVKMIIGAVEITSKYEIARALIDASGRAWAFVRAKREEDIGLRRTGFEVYDSRGQMLFTVQRPVRTALADAYEDRVLLVEVLSSGPAGNEYRYTVHRLSSDEEDETILW